MQTNSELVYENPVKILEGELKKYTFKVKTYTNGQPKDMSKIKWMVKYGVATFDRTKIVRPITINFTRWKIKKGITV